MLSAQYGANTVAVTQRVDQALEELHPTLEAQGVVLTPDLFPARDVHPNRHGQCAVIVAHRAVLVMVVLSCFCSMFARRLSPVRRFVIAAGRGHGPAVPGVQPQYHDAGRLAIASARWWTMRSSMWKTSCDVSGKTVACSTHGPPWASSMTPRWSAKCRRLCDLRRGAGLSAHSDDSGVAGELFAPLA